MVIRNQNVLSGQRDHENNVKKQKGSRNLLSKFESIQ